MRTLKLLSTAILAGASGFGVAGSDPTQCDFFGNAFVPFVSPDEPLAVPIDLRWGAPWAEIESIVSPQLAQICHTHEARWAASRGGDCRSSMLVSLRAAVGSLCGGRTEPASASSGTEGFERGAVGHAATAVCRAGEAKVCLATPHWTDGAAAQAVDGRRRMGRLRAVVGGLAFNIAPTLAAAFRRLQSTADLFANPGTVIAVYENDSSDGSPALLRTLCAAEPRAACATDTLGRLGSGALGPDHPLRFAALAEYRGKFLALARAAGGGIGVPPQPRAGAPLSSFFDVVIVVDLDFLEPGWVPPGTPFAGTAGRGWHDDGLASTFAGFTRRRLGPGDDGDVGASPVEEATLQPGGTRAPSEWHGVCANSVWLDGTRHYDTLAFRNGSATGSTMADVGARHRLMLDAMPAGPWLPAVSCFGGLAAYRAEVFDVCDYTGLRGAGTATAVGAQGDVVDGDNYSQGGDADCEHVALHRCIARATELQQARGGGLFLNPAMTFEKDASSTTTCKCMSTTSQIGI